jgi:hypothetical protein
MKTSENEMKQAEATNYPEANGIEIPLQTLFDECLNFISVSDFNI